MLEKRNHLCRVISTRTMARRKANLLFLCYEAIPRPQTYEHCRERPNSETSFLGTSQTKGSSFLDIN